MQKITTLEAIILADTLGRLNGAMEPHALDGMAWEADWQERERLRETGGLLLWRALGHDAAERKASARARAKLQERGLVETTGDKWSRLTAAGRDAARKLIALPSYEDSLIGLDFLCDSKNDPDRWTNGWLSEATLAGRDPLPPAAIGETRFPSELSTLIVDLLLPCITAGLVDWRLWGRRRNPVLYIPFPAGAEIARQRKAAGTAAPQKWTELLAGPPSRTPTGFSNEELETIVDTYTAAWSMAFHGREQAQPRDVRIWHWDLLDAPAQKRRRTRRA